MDEVEFKRDHGTEVLVPRRQNIALSEMPRYKRALQESGWLLNCKMPCMEQAPLANIELNQFQAILLARVAELEDVLRGRDLIRVEQSADQVDEVQQASDRALAISNLDRETQQLRQARRALAASSKAALEFASNAGRTFISSGSAQCPGAHFASRARKNWMGIAKR
jgi:hypothetical protein